MTKPFATYEMQENGGWAVYAMGNPICEFPTAWMARNCARMLEEAVKVYLGQGKA